jgi:hypothetical protein
MGSRACWKCTCLVSAHHGPGIGCEGAGGNCGCDLTAEQAAAPDTLRERLEGLQAAVKHLDDLCRQCRCMGSEGWHKYCDYSENVVRPLLASAPAPATPPFGSQVEDFLGLSEDEVKRAIQPAMPVEARELVRNSSRFWA